MICPECSVIYDPATVLFLYIVDNIEQHEYVYNNLFKIPFYYCYSSALTGDAISNLRFPVQACTYSHMCDSHRELKCARS